MEKVSSFAKDTRIKNLEDLVVKIGYDPSNVNEIEEIIKKKNAKLFINLMLIVHMQLIYKGPKR